MRPSDFDIEKIIEACEGTCNENIQGAIDFYYPGMNEDDLTGDDLSELYERIFECTRCNWWCSTDEEHVSLRTHEQICEQCYEEEINDEEE